MSSSMRWRSGLMGFSLIGAPVLRLECFDPSILKTESPPVIPAQSAWLLSFRLTANVPAAFSRGSGFVLWCSGDEGQYGASVWPVVLWAQPASASITKTAASGVRQLLTLFGPP